MKTQLLKSIFFFYLLSSIFFLQSKGQIVYTDVNPDTTSTTTYNLDLNNDGVIDFQILNYSQVSSSSSFCGSHGVCHYTGSIPQSVHSRIIVMGSNKFISSPVLVNSKIDSLLNWSPYTYYNISGNIFTTHCSSYPSCQASLWHQYTGAGTDIYYAVSIFSGTNKYYGWMRLDLNPVAYSFTIKDFSFNSIPNQSIKAGETTCTTPTVNLTQSGPLSFCAGDSVTLTANGTGYLYQWKKGGVNISGATSKTYIAKTAGTYKCKVTNSCGSNTSGTRRISVPCRNSNYNPGEELEHFLVYPNPATNSITIKFPPDSYQDDEAGQIQIVNLFGQIVFSAKVFSDETKIDLTKFPIGMYVVRWNSGETILSQKFSVVK